MEVKDDFHGPRLIRSSHQVSLTGSRACHHADKARFVRTPRAGMTARAGRSCFDEETRACRSSSCRS